MTPKALFILLGAAFALWFIARVHETGGGVFRGLVRALLALPGVDRAVLTVLLIVCCHFAVTKPVAPSGAPGPVPAARYQGPAAGSAPSPAASPCGGAAPGFLTPGQYAAGVALVSAATNAAAWLAAPSNAVVHAPWAVYGVAEDIFWLRTNGWSFTLGTNLVEGLYVSSSGLVSFQNPLSTPKPSSVPTNASLLAPLHGSFGTVPPQGRFWHAPTPSGGLLLTWENLYAGRDTNCPVSFQSELFGNGDFRFRYKIPAGSALRSPGHAFTNLFIGARHNGGGEAYALNDPSALTNGLELRWRAFGLLDPDVSDHDGDGLSTYDELFIHGTDPRRADTDLDGVDDGAEIALGTDPLDPDTDGDLAADSIDPDPLSPGDPGAILNCCSNTWLFHMHHALPTNGTCEASGFPWDDSLFAVTVTLDTPVADPGAVLWIGEIPLVMRDPGSWTLWLDKAATQAVWLCARHGVEVDYTVSSDVPGFFIQPPPPAPPPPPLSHVVSREGTVAAPFFTVEPAAACFHGEPITFRAVGCAAGLSGQYAWSYGGTTVVTNVPEFTVWPDIDGLPTEVSVAFMPDGLDAGAPARAGTGTLSSPRSEWPATRCSSCGYCQRHTRGSGIEEWWCDLTGRPADQSCPAAGCAPFYIAPANGTNTFFTLPVPRRPAAWPDGCATLSPWPTGHAGTGTPPPPDPDDCGHGPGCSDCRWAVDHWHRRRETSGTTFDHSGCCSCPEHNPHFAGGGGQGSGPVVYEGAVGLKAAFKAFGGGAPVPLAAGALPDSAGVVTVTGLTPSTAPYDRSVRFSRFDPHLPMTFYETDRFTVLSLDLQPDVDLDGAAGPGDDAALAADWERTWLIPVGTNAFPLKVFNDAALPGAYTLALDGPSNIVARYGSVAVRGGESNAVAFPPGPTAETLEVQADRPCTATLTLSFQGAGAAAGFDCGTQVEITAWSVDIDVDSNNDGAIDTGNNDEDGYEDYAPGLLLTVTNGLAEGAGMRYPVRLSGDVANFAGSVRLAQSAGCGQVRVWTNTAPGAAALTLPVEWDVSQGETPPAHVWVDGVATGAVSLAYSAIRNGQTLTSDSVRLTVIPPASYAPGGGNFAAIWAPLKTRNNANTNNNVGWLDGEYLAAELSSQGWPEVVWYKDETGDTDLDVGTCTVENYLNMRNAGVVCVTASHGEPGYHHAVYAPYTEEGRQLIENWCSNRLGMVCFETAPIPGDTGNPGFYSAKVSSGWMRTNWKPWLDTNRAITVWAICYSGTPIGQMYSVKEGAGGRWRIGYTVPISSFENYVVNETFFQFMNGKQGDGMRRTAGAAWNGGNEYAGYGVTMSGNPWTTLCPAHIPANAWLPISQFPDPGSSANEGKGWGCVLFDTYISDNGSAALAIQQQAGTTITDVRWLGVGVGKRGLGFRYDKSACDMIWLRTDSNKCLNEGEGGGRPLVRRVFSWPAGWQEWSF